MKFTSSLLLAAAVLSFSACTESNTTETETETTSTETVTADPFAGSAISDSAATTGTSFDAAPSAETEQMFQEPNAAGSKPAGTASGKLNPAHGEPGHDCALPVGAPMDSKKSTAPAATAQVNTTLDAPKTLTPTPTPTPTTTLPANQDALAAGLNPAHGQPGHDCALPVGAPLKK